MKAFRTGRRLLGALLLASAAALPAAAQDQRPLRVVLSQELSLLDPVISTNTATRAFGYMIWDTLVAMDGKGGYRPQMLDSWAVSEDGLTYTFKLRPGQRWSDGKPVTAEDCIASIRRWGAADGLGQQLIAATRAMEVVSTDSFTIALSRPFGFVIEALGKPGNRVPFIMPASVANSDPTRPITTFIGSGPYTFDRAEWRQGDRAIFRRNPMANPRQEPADGLAGGKAAHFETVEFVSLPDVATRVSALRTGEVDLLEFVPPDYVDQLRRDRNTVVSQATGGMEQYVSYISINHAQPPFNNPLVRRALQAALDQSEVVAGMGLPDDMVLQRCLSIYTCNSPGASNAGTAPLENGGIARAKELLRQAGYSNEPVVFLHPTDSTVLNPVGSVVVDQMRRAGFNVDEWNSDWASVAQRRLKREPVGQGGWSVVPLGWSGIDVLNPMLHAAIAYNCQTYPGWFCDEAMKPLLARYAETVDPAQRQALADQIQARMHENGNMIIAGQMTMPQARRAELTDVVSFAYPVLWNLRRR